MFEKILNWFRRIFMIDSTNVNERLGVEVSLSSEMIDALTLWVEMYENSAGWLTGNVKSLNIPAAIASEIARTVTIEMKVELGESERAKYLSEQLEPLMDKIRDATEYGCAKGGLVLKPFVNGDNVDIDIVHADHFFPVDFNTSGEITAAIFVDQRQRGRFWFTRLEHHDSNYQENPGSGEKPKYKVVNRCFKSEARDTLGQPCLLEEVPEWSDIEPEGFIEGVDFPMYAYFRYPMANNIDSGSPLGVSCYSRATDLIKEADLQWSRFLWEMESGERALYVDALAFGKDEDGNPLLPNRRLYRALETGSMEGDFFEDWTPTLREAELIKGLEDILRKVEFNCGLAFGTLTEAQAVDKTATEIKMSKQRSAATISDTQKALQKAMERLLEAMDAWADIEGLAPEGELHPNFTFDDSIVVDKESQKAQDLLDVNAGIMSKVEYRMRNFGEDLKTAEEKVAEATKEKNEAMALMMGNMGNDPENPQDKKFGKVVY